MKDRKIAVEMPLIFPNTDSQKRSASKINLKFSAEGKMRRGNLLIFLGFLISIIGIVSYCLACFTSVANDTSAYFFDNMVPLAKISLGVIGIGTLFWLVGSLMYLRGAMDTDFEGQKKL